MHSSNPKVRNSPSGNAQSSPKSKQEVMVRPPTVMSPSGNPQLDSKFSNQGKQGGSAGQSQPSPCDPKSGSHTPKVLPGQGGSMGLKNGAGNGSKGKGKRERSISSDSFEQRDSGTPSDESEIKDLGPADHAKSQEPQHTTHSMAPSNVSAPRSSTPSHGQAASSEPGGMQKPPPKVVYVFSTEMANKAAEAVLKGQVETIVSFHIQNIPNKAERNAIPLNTQIPPLRIDTKPPASSQLPASQEQTPPQNAKMQQTPPIPVPAPASKSTGPPCPIDQDNPSLENKVISAGSPTNSTPLQAEGFGQTSTPNNRAVSPVSQGSNSSTADPKGPNQQVSGGDPPNMGENPDGLSQEQLEHRERSLQTLRDIQRMLFPDEKEFAGGQVGGPQPNAGALDGPQKKPEGPIQAMMAQSQSLGKGPGSRTEGGAPFGPQGHRDMPFSPDEVGPPSMNAQSGPIGPDHLVDQMTPEQVAWLKLQQEFYEEKRRKQEQVVQQCSLQDMMVHQHGPRGLVRGPPPPYQMTPGEGWGPGGPEPFSESMAMSHSLPPRGMAPHPNVPGTQMRLPGFAGMLNPDLEGPNVANATPRSGLSGVPWPEDVPKLSDGRNFPPGQGVFSGPGRGERFPNPQGLPEDIFQQQLTEKQLGLPPGMSIEGIRPGMEMNRMIPPQRHMEPGHNPIFPRLPVEGSMSPSRGDFPKGMPPQMAAGRELEFGMGPGGMKGDVNLNVNMNSNPPMIPQKMREAGVSPEEMMKMRPGISEMHPSQQKMVPLPFGEHPQQDYGVGPRPFHPMPQGPGVGLRNHREQIGPDQRTNNRLSHMPPLPLNPSNNPNSLNTAPPPGQRNLGRKPLDVSVGTSQVHSPGINPLKSPTMRQVQSPMLGSPSGNLKSPQTPSQLAGILAGPTAAAAAASIKSPPVMGSAAASPVHLKSPSLPAPSPGWTSSPKPPLQSPGIPPNHKASLAISSPAMMGNAESGGAPPPAVSQAAPVTLPGNLPSSSHENHLKQPGICNDDNASLSHTAPASDVPVVSVIVKNTCRQESFEAEKEANHLGPGPLHNGFRGSDLPLESHNYGKFDSTFINGDGLRNYPEKMEPSKPEPLPTFSQFSPISSPEPDDALKENSNSIVDKHKHVHTPYFPPHPMYIPSGSSVLDLLSRTLPEPEFSRFMSTGPSLLDLLSKKLPEPELSMFDQYCKRDPKIDLHGLQESRGDACRREGDKSPEKRETASRDLVDANSFHGEGLPLGNVHSNNVGESKVSAPEMNFSSSSVPPRQRIKPAHSKLSSCVAALVALQAKKVAGISKEDQALVAKEPPGPLKDGMKGSPKMPKSPKSPRSPLEMARKASKQPESPRSVCSDTSSKGSPSVATGSPPAIPKVRIKTIKTSSGEIKRMVTRILPEADDFGRSPRESPAEHLATEELVKPCPSPEPGASAEMEPCEGFAKAATPEVNLASPQADGPMADIPVNSTPGASLLAHGSGGATKAGNGGPQLSKKQTPPTPPGTAPPASNPASLLPKAVHLANLNLVPHSVAASVAAKSSVQRRGPSQLTQMSVPLVHQVKKAAPLVVEAFNKVLHATNPVPVYTPNLSPPLESSIHLPASGYCCLECGDSFALEKSLAQHYSRRSVHIEVVCTQCSATLLFLNKCSLLKHARDHKSRGLVMQCSQLFMKPISVDQMFMPSPTSSSLSSSSSSSSMSSTSPSTRASSLPPKTCTTPGSGTGGPANGPPALPLYKDPLRLIRHGLKCFECNKQALDYVALAAHYQRTSEDNDGLTCQVCQMLLPNRCSYCAHQRIHAHRSPYCCPECGAICQSAYFQTHVKENCLHYSRKVGYRCTHCGVVFMSQAMLKVHIHEKHCEVFHKCSFCPMAFKSADSTTAHITSQHPAEPHKTSQVIYKCSCETVFNKKRLLQEHFQQNAKRLMVGVFKCPHCQLVYMQKLQLMQHVKSVHGVPENPETLTSTRQKSETATSSPLPASKELSVINGTSQTSLLAKETSPESKSKAKHCSWTCRECSQWIPDRETYVSHMKKSHGKNVKRYPCRQCERSFSATNNLRKHIRNNHDTTKKVYTCWYCTDEVQTFPQLSLLENHISLMHGIKNPDLSQIPRTKAPAEDLSKAKSPKRVTAEGLDQRETTTASESEDPPAKKLKVAHWKCAKCGFATASETDFLEHIPRHKTDSSTYQCLLCGLCYTSHISLNRHLFIVHKIKDPEEGDGEEEEEDDEEEEEPDQEEEKEGVETETSEKRPAEPKGKTNIVEGEGGSTKSQGSESNLVSC